MYSKDFDDKLQYARTYMLLWAPFFGSLTMNIAIEERDYPERTVWTNGKKVFFETNYAKKLTREHFTGLLMHEILHVALMHQNRIKGRNEIRWNNACDYVVNLMVKDEELRSKGKLKLPANVTLSNDYKELSVEQVYERLRDGSGGNSQGDTIDFDLLQEEDFLTAEEINEINDTLAYAANIAEAQGTMPLGLRREINTLLYPKVDWRILLKEFIQAFPADWDFSNRDRRFIQTPFFLPQFSGEIVRIYVAIDTSGSITKEILDSFMTETYAILTNFDRVEMTLICVDARMQNVEKVHSLEEALNFEIRGGGGTDFRDTFKYLDEQHDCDGLIFFTDLYATLPDEVPHFKTLWVCTSDKKAPFGKTIAY